MTFVDSNVFIYAVGRPHPLRITAREFFKKSSQRRETLCTSAEVLQELTHAYLRVGRLQTLDSAMSLATGVCMDVWPLEEADVTLARLLHDRYPTLGARDLCHLASCRRRDVSEIMTFDQALASAYQESG